MRKRPLYSVQSYLAERAVLAVSNVYESRLLLMLKERNESEAANRALSGQAM